MWYVVQFSTGEISLKLWRGTPETFRWRRWWRAPCRDRLSWGWGRSRWVPCWNISKWGDGAVLHEFEIREDQVESFRKCWGSSWKVKYFEFEFEFEDEDCGIAWTKGSSRWTFSSSCLALWTNGRSWWRCLLLQQKILNFRIWIASNISALKPSLRLLLEGGRSLHWAGRTRPFVL